MTSIWELCEATIASKLYYGAGLVGFDPKTEARLSYHSTRSFVLTIPGQPKKRYIRTCEETVALARASKLLTLALALA